MFLNHYGLREQPFGVTPDPRFLDFSSSHREALAALQYGIQSERGFLALIAKPGMGKTTLLFHFLEKLRNSARTAFLFQTQCDARGFLHSLMADLGVNVQNGDHLIDMQSQLNDILIRERRTGRRFVLVIDEAQNLDDSVLETLRMLSNFEIPRAKLMHIVLAGQPQLADRLASANMVQLRQRISIWSRLTQLNPAETAQYINHRLRVAGYSGKPLFTPEALAIIGHKSEGIPRTINNLCFHALTVGFANNQKQIGTAIVREVLADLDVESLGSNAMTDKKTGRDPMLIFMVPSGQAKRDPRMLPPVSSVIMATFRTRLMSALRSVSSAVRVAWGRLAVANLITQTLKLVPQLAHSANINGPSRSISAAERKHGIWIESRLKRVRIRLVRGGTFV